jgi:hypothetical protein
METTETIVCNCLNEIELSADTICPTCQRELLTTKSLQDKQTLIDARICSLRVESSAISVEIYLRKIRHPSRPYLVENDLAWMRRQGVPFISRRRTRQAKPLPPINLDDFD